MTGLAVAILTFVLLSGNLLQAFELLARGVPASTLFAFVGYLAPVLLTYTIPLAVLSATVTVFSRLSADMEITAMRASGISLWQILSPCLMVTGVFVACCLLLHLWIAPACNEAADRLRHGTALTNPAAFIEPGRPVRMPGYILFVEELDGKRLRHVQVYSFDDEGHVQQDIQAPKGVLFEGEDGASLTLQLKNAGIVNRADGAAGASNRIQTPEMELNVALGSKMKTGPLFRHPSYLQLPDLLSAIDVLRQRGRNVTPLFVELHTRFALSLSPLAFLLIGVPFGIRTQRSEASVGMVVSFFLALVFYAFIVLSDNLKSNPSVHPDLLVWIPVLLFQIGGLVGFHYIANR